MATQITFTLINQSEKIILIETNINETLVNREVHLGQPLSVKKGQYLYLIQFQLQ